MDKIFKKYGIYSRNYIKNSWDGRWGHNKVKWLNNIFNETIVENFPSLETETCANSRSV